MSNDITVTVCGFTGTGPELRHAADGGRPWTQFRLASTPSLRDAEGKWRDGETTWLTVKAFGRLAENLCDSVRKPDPLVVTGRLRTEVWEDRDGNERSTLTLVAESAGHDLTFGRTRFARVTRSQADGASGPADRAGEGEGAGRDAIGDVGGSEVTDAPDSADAGERTHLGDGLDDALAREFETAAEPARA